MHWACLLYTSKALEEGMEETGAERIMCLVMDPETGEILASAVTPGYDPNNATEPDDEEELKAFKELSEEEQTNYLFQMWRNPIVSDTYEPGSTFKLITASSALDEGVISLTDTFSCNTKINVAGVTLHCWSSRDHGTQTVSYTHLDVYKRQADMAVRTIFSLNTYEDVSLG